VGADAAGQTALAPASDMSSGSTAVIVVPAPVMIER